MMPGIRSVYVEYPFSHEADFIHEIQETLETFVAKIHRGSKKLERSDKNNKAHNEQEIQNENGDVEKHGIDLSIRLIRWILTLVGAWPDFALKISRKNKFQRKFTNVVCWCLVAFVLVPCILYYILEVKDVYTKIKLTGPLSFIFTAAVKYLLLMIRGEYIHTGIMCIEDDWKRTKHPDDRKVMIENANFGQRITIICGFFMYGGVIFFYLALPSALGKIVDVQANVSYWSLSFPVARIIADTRYSPANEIFFCVQCLSGFVTHSITTGSCSLAASFAMHACGQLEVLMVWLEHLVNGRQYLSNNVDRRLAMVIEQHVRVLSFIDLTEKLLREISIMEVIACTLNICLLGYYLLKEYTETIALVTYSVLFISLSFNIFVFCYIGEILAGQCIKIGEKSYLIDWYRLPGKKGLGLVLMIAMSNSTLRLSAGGFINLSLQSFGVILKTSFAYLNMLRKLTS